MAEYWFKFELEHVNGNGKTERVRVTTQKNDKSYALGKAFEKIAGKYGYNSITEAMNEWSHTGPTWIGFEDSPCTDFDDITDEIEAYPETLKVVVQPPYTEKYNGPPKLYVDVRKRGQENAVKQKIEQYYDGFDIETKTGKVVVTVSAAVQS